MSLEHFRKFTISTLKEKILGYKAHLAKCSPDQMKRWQKLYDSATKVMLEKNPAWEAVLLVEAEKMAEAERMAKAKAKAKLKAEEEASLRAEIKAELKAEAEAAAAE